MYKKILFGAGCVIILLFSFYFSYLSVLQKSVLKSAKEAITNNNDAYFLKYNEYYDTNPLLNYVNSENGATISVYQVYTNVDDEGNSGNALAIILKNLPETTAFDGNAKISNSSIVMYYNQSSYKINFSTSSYEEMKGLIVYAYYSDIIENFNVDVTPDHIQKISFFDSGSSLVLTSGVVGNYLFDLTDDSEEIWELNGTPGYTKSELNKILYPSDSMWKCYVTVIVVLIALVGLGFFFFWPRKPRLKEPDEDNTNNKNNKNTVINV